MKTVIKNAKIADGHSETVRDGDIYIDKGIISNPFEPDIADQVIDARGNHVIPGLIDLHVHFRDPGQTYKEDINSGSMAAAAGGYTTVQCMPNTIPVVDSTETLRYINDKGYRFDKVNLLAASAMTAGQAGSEIVDFSKLMETDTVYGKMAESKAGIFAVTEDGKSLLDNQLMLKVCRDAEKLGLIVMDHPENTVSFAPGSPESEENIVERDIELCRLTGCCMHLQHISTGKSLQLIREAKDEGLSITCEAAPHHFTLNKDAIKQFGTNAKMNPPLRTEDDREAVVEGLIDGTVDIIATDHAPHSTEDKSVDFDKSPPGITGLETGFAVSYTVLVKNGPLNLVNLVALMSTEPANLAGIKRGKITTGNIADLTVVNLNESYKIDSGRFFSGGHNTPFEGTKVCGKILYTIKDGKVTYKNDR